MVSLFSQSLSLVIIPLFFISCAKVPIECPGFIVVCAGHCGADSVSCSWIKCRLPPLNSNSTVGFGFSCMLRHSYNLHRCTAIRLLQALHVSVSNLVLISSRSLKPDSSTPCTLMSSFRPTGTYKEKGFVELYEGVTLVANFHSVEWVMSAAGHNQTVQV